MAHPESAIPPPAKRSRWRRWAGELAFFVVLVISFQLWQARDAPSGAAPHFAGQLVDGQSFDLAAWRAGQPGKPHLLYFWAEWCAVCRSTAGSVSAIAADWPVVTVAVQSGTPEQVVKAMQERGYQWPTLSDPQGEILRKYGAHGVPAFVIIDPAGNIRSLSLGYTSEIGLRLRLWWASRKPS